MRTGSLPRAPPRRWPGVRASWCWEAEPLGDSELRASWVLAFRSAEEVRQVLKLI